MQTLIGLIITPSTHGGYLATAHAAPRAGALAASRMRQFILDAPKMEAVDTRAMVDEGRDCCGLFLTTRNLDLATLDGDLRSAMLQTGVALA